MKPPSAPPEPVQLMVEFRNRRQWQEVSRQIAETPGVHDFEVGGLSEHGASVALHFPGGGEPLAAALSGLGLEVRNLGGIWQVRPNF